MKNNSKLLYFQSQSESYISFENNKLQKKYSTLETQEFIHSFNKFRTSSYHDILWSIINKKDIKVLKNIYNMILNNKIINLPTVDSYKSLIIKEIMTLNLKVEKDLYKLYDILFHLVDLEDIMIYEKNKNISSI